MKIKKNILFIILFIGLFLCGSYAETTPLDEFHLQLEESLDENTLILIDSMESENDMIQFHFTLGMSLRNDSGLWSGDSNIYKYLKDIGFTHPDDMSSVILETFWCKRHGLDFELEKKAKYYAEYWNNVRKSGLVEEDRYNKAVEQIRNMMIGWRFESINAPILQIPNKEIDFSLRARFLGKYNNGIFIAVRKRIKTDDNIDIFGTIPYFLDLSNYSIHKVQIPEIHDICSTIVIENNLWVYGHTSNNEQILLMVNGTEHKRIELPEKNENILLGYDQNNLLIVSSDKIYLFNSNNQWEKIYEGNTELPRSGIPPQKYMNTVYFRDEGSGENQKKLWWLNIEDSKLSSFVKDVGLVGQNGPRWENCFSFAIANDTTLWINAGEGNQKKSIIIKNPDNQYNIGLFNNSFSDQYNEIDLSAIELFENNVYLAGKSGLFILKDDLLIPLVFFDNTEQKIPINNSRNNYHWGWDPNAILLIDDNKYLISGTFGGIYIIENHQENWQITALDEDLGNDVVW